MRYRLAVEADSGGWRFQLLRRRLPFVSESRMALQDWIALAQGHAGAALLLSLVDSGEADAAGDGAVRLTHGRMATLSQAEARRLELPPSCPLTLFLSHDAPLSGPTFRLDLEWRRTDGQRLFGVQRLGTRLQSGNQCWLALDPLYSALEAIDRVNAASGDTSSAGLDRRMAAYAELKAALVRMTGDLRVDDYLRGLTIHCATGLGIDLEPGTDKAPFLPTLYGSRPEPTAAPGDDTGADDGEPTHRREPLLPNLHAKTFQKRFLAQGARSHNRLGTGVYTVLDAPAAAALQVVAQVNAAEAETRGQFRVDPMAFLTPAIEAAGGAGEILCALRGYGDRVTGTGDWVRPGFSFPLPVTRDWFPAEEVETFQVALPEGALLVVRADQVAELRDLITKAQEAGDGAIDFAGQTIPVSEALAETVKGLVGKIETGAPKAKQEPGQDEAHAPWTVLLTKDNEEALLYKREQRNEGFRPTPGLPGGLKRAPKDHQRNGIAWLQDGYRAGMPGLLLADDMGLGKTYQVLAFLKWLRDGLSTERRRPLLVVAPKTLLGNWLEEIERHLGGEGLGTVLRVQDKGLKALRQVQGGHDIRSGRATLDVDAIERAGLALTSYETLRDYQMSFAKVRFLTVVYDEAQRIKNPAALVTRAAKGQQADFTLLVTGTPIENDLIDLWTLFDIAWPGFLGFSAKAFLKHYRSSEADRREELKQRLIEPNQCRDGTPLPPVMLRRFKDDVLDGLPRRTVVATRDPMPPVQRDAYDAVCRHVGKTPGGTLAALQQLRAVALHPHLGQLSTDHSGYIAASARFERLFKILDEIRKKNEKALVFVDLREAQRALYELMQRRYKLPAPRPEIINGATAAAVRDRIRQAFQARVGFDVLLLGPKAAGLGLTLTAANHVIHLNRWWNPAVEDQCSDRVYRIGQERPVTIYLPQAIHPDLGDGSFDALLHGLLDEKRTLSREIVVPIQFDERDFRALYERSLGGSISAEGSSSEVDSLDWLGFEHWVADRLRDAGLQVDLTPAQGDGGVDVIAQANNSGRPLFVQCKHTARGAKGRIDEAAVEDLCRAREHLAAQYPHPVLAAVTNGRFSLAAEGLAVERGVSLIDGSRLPRIGVIVRRLISDRV